MSLLFDSLRIDCKPSIANFVQWSMEKLAGDLLLGLKFANSANTRLVEIIRA